MPAGGGGQGPLLDELWLFDCSRCGKAAPQAGARQGSWKRMHVAEQHAEGLSEVVPAARVYHAAAAPLAADTDLAYGALVIFGGLGLASELHEVVRDQGSERRAQVQAYPVGSEGGYHSQQHDLLPDVWRLDANLDDLAGPSWEVRVRVGLGLASGLPKPCGVTQTLIITPTLTSASRAATPARACSPHKPTARASPRAPRCTLAG